MANEEKDAMFLWWFVAIAVFTIVVAVLIAHWVPSSDPIVKLKVAATAVALVLVFLFGFVILAAMATGKIDISELIEEESTGASTSRFQLLIFTFVIGLSFVVIVACNCKLPDVPANVLALLGVSASTYGVSKGIQASMGYEGGSGAPKTPKHGEGDPNQPK
jgi:uncharacterized BrkB/YihY/UPF0761 family membrane protein